VRDAGRAVTASPPRLAVLTVALVRDDGDRALLELQLSRLRRHTAGPFTVHAVARRVPDDVRDWLAGQPDVRLLDVPPVADTGSREHGAYLDALLTAARATDATHFAVFDLDSFPVVDDWLARVTELLPPGAGVAAVLREENGDVCLPHPSGTVLTREFVETHAVSFSPDTDGTPEFRRFLRESGQRADTGIRIARVLWSGHLPWARLRRTNAVDVHPVIAGVYADCIFHLGAGSRVALFRADLARSRVHRWTRPLERVPVGRGRARDVKRRALAKLRGPAEARMIAANREAAAAAEAALLADPDAFLARLRGHGPDPVSRPVG
jgi:hypothetical protein